MPAEIRKGAALILLAAVLVYTQETGLQIRNILSKCHRKSPIFDTCIRKALNDIRPYFKTGIPELGVASFDPHFATKVEQYRGADDMFYRLKLTNVFERGWTISKVTKFKADWKNRRIVYSQYFPEKSLNGEYELEARFLGTSLRRSGVWNLTLYDYAQTTTIRRLPVMIDGQEIFDGQPLDVRVEIDRIGDMVIHVSNILNGANALENILDSIINASWRPGFVFVRPLINDLVSTAFTEIWSKSFRNFPFQEFVPQ